jgi:hypothetical protein
MATMNITRDRLELQLTRGEKVGGLLRDHSVPLTAVQGVEVLPDGLEAARGVRAPGLALPWARKIGTWRRPGAKTLVSVRRDQPAVRVDLSGQRHSAWLVGLDDAEQLAARLRAATGRTGQQ